jgi:hypothetical protein
MRKTDTGGAPAQRHRPLGPWTGVALATLAWGLAIPAPVADEAQVYRCQGPGGAIEFRQAPCAPGSAGEALTIEDHPTGWTPAPAPPPKNAAHTQAKAPKKHSGPSARERQVETCEKKQQQVEEIDRRLRLGTKARQSTELRHRRRGLEDYLYQNCD